LTENKNLYIKQQQELTRSYRKQIARKLCTL